MRSDEHYMRLALDEARAAAEAGEVPIGAVVVCDDAVIARGRNRREGDADPTAHAELVAVREASRALSRWRLTGCTVYVTLEPCPMCAGAIVQARIPLVVFGAADPKGGAVRTLYELLSDKRLNHQAEIIGDVLAASCGELLSQFFQQQRRLGKK
jgi:tRNA(adenine34) deaminase